jgi:hypothetical protein
MVICFACVLRLQVPCTSIPNSASMPGGSCACTRAPFTVNAFTGNALGACLSTRQLGSACPEAYPVEVVNHTGIIGSCLSPDTLCPSGYKPLLGDNPLRQLRCQPTTLACTYNGFNAPMAKSLVSFSSRRRIQGALPIALRSYNTRRGCKRTRPGGKGSTQKRREVNYAARPVGCVSTTSTDCPEALSPSGLARTTSALTCAQRRQSATPPAQL